MKNEKPALIQLRQIIISFGLFVLICYFLNICEVSVAKLLVCFLFVSFVLMIEPTFHIEAKVPFVVHRMIFVLSTYISLVFIQPKPFITFGQAIFFNFKKIIIPILVILVTIVSSIKTDFLAISSSRYKDKPTVMNLIVDELLIVFSVIGEEMLFRCLLYFSISKETSNFLLPLISGLAFTCAHYLNRWSKKMYIWKNYIKFFILGTALMIIFRYTKCISLTVLLHLLYNYPGILAPLVQYFFHKKRNAHMFNDYD